VNPVPTTYDPLELHITVPPPTQDLRKKAQQQAVEAGERALQAVRQARAAQQKRHRQMELSKTVRPDDLRKASKKMEEIVEKGNMEMKKITETAKKAMDV
jgi:ribosome recycling factor